MNVTYEPPQWSRGGPANAPEWNWDATDERKADALARIAKALEALAARKPNPRIVIVPVPGNYTAEDAKQLAKYLREALEEEE